MSSTEGWIRKVCPYIIRTAGLRAQSLSRVRLFVTPWTAARQAPLSMGFSRQQYWSGLPFPSPMHESEKSVIPSCPTHSDPMDCSLPGSSTHGIFQARVLEWGAIASHVQFFATPWTVACRAPLSMGILQARILDWLPCPPPGDLPNAGVESMSPALLADSLLSEPPGKPLLLSHEKEQN